MNLTGGHDYEIVWDDEEAAGLEGVVEAPLERKLDGWLILGPEVAS